MSYRYESVFLHAAFQYCGHVDEYFIDRTHYLQVIYFQTRFGKGGHLLRRYEDGKLVAERRLTSARNPLLYYFLYGWHHTRELLRFTHGRKAPTLVLFTHPVACFGMTLVRLLRRVKYVFWVWDYFPAPSFILRAFEAFKRHCVRRCDFAFGVSPALCKHYDAKIRLVRLGVTHAPNEPHAQNHEPRILFVGQLREGQGIENLLDFIAANPNYRLTIMGGAANDFDKTIQAKIDELQIADRVRFPNRFVTDAELRAEASPCFCGLALYDTDPNNFTHYADPGKVKSYLEMGLPVVMTRISHTAKLLEEFHAGEVIDSLADLSSAVAKIAADNAAYAKGVRAFTNRFNYQTYYDAEFAEITSSAPCPSDDSVLSYAHAAGIRDASDGRSVNADGGGLHPFATRREQALLDLGRIRLLEKALSAEPGGTADSRTRDPLQRLIEAAKSAGLFFARPQWAIFGDLVSKRTGESAVYFNEREQAYYKVKSPSSKAAIKRTAFEDALYEHIIHNILFPHDAYEFIGVSEEFGELRVILKQPEISTEQFPADEAVAAHLAKLGLNPEDRYFFGNEVLAVTDVSAHGDNVLLDESGQLHFIDPLIRLKRPAREVIAWLVGDIAHEH